MCAGSCDAERGKLVPVDENVRQVIVQAELEQGIVGTGDRPAVLVMMIHDQTMGFCAVPEFTVMVGTTPGTVLDTFDVIMVMYHKKSIKERLDRKQLAGVLKTED